MLHARSRWGAWGAGPILSAASFSHSPRRSPAHPGWVEATASVAVALSDVVRDVPVSARLLAAGGQAHAGRHHAGLDVAPQRDQQLAGERHDHDRADAPFGTARALGEPAAQRVLRLEPQPAPGELDQDAAHPGVAAAVEPLLTLHAAAAERRASEAGIAGDRKSTRLNSSH